jgi:hypothetical protein
MRWLVHFLRKPVHPRFKLWKREMDEKFEAEHGPLIFSSNYDICMIVRKLGRRHTFTVISNGVQQVMFPRL